MHGACVEFAWEAVAMACIAALCLSGTCWLCWQQSAAEGWLHIRPGHPLARMQAAVACLHKARGGCCLAAMCKHVTEDAGVLHLACVPD